MKGEIATQKALAEVSALRQDIPAVVVKMIVEDPGKSRKTLVARLKERVVQKGTSACLEHCQGLKVQGQTMSWSVKVVGVACCCCFPL